MASSWGSGGSRRLAGAAGLIATVALAGPVVAAPAAVRTVTRHYETACRPDEGLLLLPCTAGVGSPLGGVANDAPTMSFSATGSERHVSIAVHDLTGATVPFTVDGVDNEPAPFDSRAYCGRATFTVEPYSVVNVYLFQAAAAVNWPPVGCQGIVTAGAATSGEVTASFRR